MSQTHSKASLIRELYRVFKILNRPFSRREYDEIGDVHHRTIEKVFGSWSKALDESGLKKKFDEFKQVDKEIKEFNPDKEVREKWKQQKEDLLRKAEHRKIEWTRNQMQKIHLLQDVIEESLAKVEPPVVEVHPLKIYKRTNAKGHVTLWFDFSDLQLGTLITSESMGGLNKHNWIIWKEKLEVWKRVAIEKIAYYHENYVVDQVVIAMLGDMVEGQDIFGSQIWQIDRHVVDQALFGATDTAAAFSEVFLTFPDLKFHILEVFGNHGRIGKKGDAPYSCSMDKVYQRFLEAQIKGIREIKNLTYHKNECWFYVVEIYGWNHLLLHGDQGMSSLWSGRPTVNGLEKGIVRYNQMLQQNIHFVHVGHFHTEAQMSFNVCRLLMNGSFIGTSEFSASKMVSSSPPLQVMHVFNERVGLDRTERIYLIEGDVKNPIIPESLNG